MTGPEMNGHVTKKIKLRRVDVLMYFSVLALGGCASAFEAGTEPSAMAGQVQVLVDANRTYPSWADFPRATANVPVPSSIAERVATLQASDRLLQQQAARIEWVLGDSEIFESQARDRLSRIQLSSDVLMSDTEIEALAERLRQRAKAPPPIGRGP